MYLPFSARLGAAISLAATAAFAQVTDEAVFADYGASCGGVQLTVSDQILGNGNHWLTFDVTGAAPNQPIAIFFGGQQANLPLPFSACSALNNMAFSAQGMAAPDGTAVWQFTAPATTQFTINAQAISLDISNVAITASQGVEILFPGQSPTVDPAWDNEYPCYYIRNYNWNFAPDGVPSVTGQIRFPSATCDPDDGPPAGRPLVIFMHGINQSHTDHDYLMAYLARNGFVTASIANGSHMTGSNEGRARQAISYLNAMHTFWGWKHRLSNKVVFMGQGRGGEAALTAARLLEEIPSIGAENYDVRSVVSIAPTDAGGDGTDPKESLTGSMSKSFLAIYGSRDNDITGGRLEDGLVAPERTAFAIYDRAGHESSSEGLLISPRVSKSMIYVMGASHYCFEDSCVPSDPATISNLEHQWVARGYINAFLQWKVNGESDYRAYFAGDDVPTTIDLAGVTCYTQFDDGAKRVVDNFEQGPWSQNSMGGSVTKTPGIVVLGEDELWQMDFSSPNETRGMRIKWNDNVGLPWVGWSVPNTFDVIVGSKRNVTGFSYLSLRVAQNYLDGWNTPGEDQDFYLRLQTSSGYSNLVKVSDHGRVPYPEEFIHYPFPQPMGDYTKTAMTTIRVPLDAFTNADLTDVRNVYLRFDVPGHESGSIHIDSLEFVH